MKKEFNVTGMTCSACSSRVERVTNKIEGTSNVSVNLLTNSMSLDLEDEAALEKIIFAVEKAGFSIEEVKKEVKKEARKEEAVDKAKVESDKLKSRLITSIAFLIPLMYISMGGMMGAPLPSFLSGHKGASSYAFIQFLLALPIIFANRQYYTKGFKSLFSLAPNMDSLIAIGSSSALIYGIFAIFRINYGIANGDMDLVARYHMDLYFEAAATILALITVGKYLESKSREKTTDAISKLLDLAPKTALVLRNNKEMNIPADEVLVGDIVIVKNGMAAPVDGEVIEGSASFDEASITGESLPVLKNVGDKIVTSSINKGGYIKFVAKKVGEDTTFMQIIALVKEASSTKAPIAKLADKISGIFVPVVILISLITFAFWLITSGDFEQSLSFAITVLVISCPCALGLATPVSIMVAAGKGASEKILIKSGEALETLHNVKTVVLDKTGTITNGKPEVSDIIPINIEKSELLNLAYSLENQSEHPLAFAINSYAKENNATLYNTSEFKSVAGQGVIAKIDESTLMAGNEVMFNEFQINISNYKTQFENFAKEGKTPLLFSKNNELIGIITVSDKVKESSKKAVELLNNLGVEVVMLTGDNNKTATAIASSVGIKNIISDVLPNEKESVVRKYQENGNIVAMVGDGVNDSPALARADVGIAIGAGTDIAIESADIVLIKNDLVDVATAINLSKATIKNIKQNLFWAFIYNTIGIPIAAGVFYASFGLKLSPDFAALAMSFSSVFVVTNALRLRNFKNYN